ncbi:hypothetical protein SUDANB66_05872 [Streptomyces sp. SudanB66_2053]
MLELLGEREHPVGEMLPHVGIEPAHPSQRPAVLRRANLVVGRKEDSTVYYSPTDPHVAELLRVARTILSGVLTGQADSSRTSRRPRPRGRPGPCHDPPGQPGSRAAGQPGNRGSLAVSPPRPSGSAGTAAAPGGPPGGSG